MIKIYPVSSTAVNDRAEFWWSFPAWGGGEETVVLPQQLQYSVAQGRGWD